MSDFKHTADANLEEDYGAFVNEAVQTNEVPHRFQSTQDMIGRDLVGSPFPFLVGYFFLSVVGYFVSLSICAQNTQGLTKASHHMEHLFHSLGPIPCGILCGLIFSGVPLGFSMLFLNGFRRRYLISKYSWLMSLLTIAASAAILLMPSGALSTEASEIAQVYRDNPIRILTWSLSAVALPLVFTQVYRVLFLKKLC